MESSKNIEDTKNYKDLLIILENILNHLNIIKLNNKEKVENEIKKLEHFRIDTKEIDLNLFAYFLQKLFLDENKKEIDFDIKSLENILPKETIINIFTELKDGIKEHNFFYFLKRIGSLFSTFYFIDQTVQEFLEPNINKCKNMYECILFILFSCKKKTDGKWFLGISKIYYQLEYENDLLIRLIISTRKHFNLLYGDKFFESSDEEKSIGSDDEEEEEEEEEEGQENIEGKKENNEIGKIISNIRINFFEFFCHLILFYENELKEFSSIFLNFIIERKNLTSFFELETYSKERTLNEYEKEYLKYIIKLFDNVFFDFKKKSIDDFMKDLFEFISHRKEKYNNTFFDLAFKIGEIYKLQEKDVAIISMILFNKSFINELEDISKKDDYNISKYKEENNLNDQEIIVLNYIISQKNKNKKENVKNELDTNAIEKGNISLFKEHSHNNISNQYYNEKNSKLESEKYKLLSSKTKNKLNDYSKAEIEEKFKKYDEKIKCLEELLKKNNEKVKELEDKIIGISCIYRKKIFFHDVSKYYILEFAKKYLNIYNLNAYDCSMLILRYDFKEKKIEYLENIMIKITYHYLKGNILAHFEYSIENNLQSIKWHQKLLKRIFKSYSSFLEFNKQEIKDLKKELSDEKTMLSLFKSNY